MGYQSIESKIEICLGPSQEVLSTYFSNWTKPRSKPSWREVWSNPWLDPIVDLPRVIVCPSFRIVWSFVDFHASPQWGFLPLVPPHVGSNNSSLQQSESSLEISEVYYFVEIFFFLQNESFFVGVSPKASWNLGFVLCFKAWNRLKSISVCHKVKSTRRTCMYTYSQRGNRIKIIHSKGKRRRGFLKTPYSSSSSQLDQLSLQKSS